VRGKLINVVSAPFELQRGMTCRIGASIGSARYPADGMDADTLIKVSDTRMFNYKKARAAGS